MSSSFTIEVYGVYKDLLIFPLKSACLKHVFNQLYMHPAATANTATATAASHAPAHTPSPLHYTSNF